MAEIPLTGIADNFIVPGQYAEILFAQGPASVALGAREVCLVMPMTAAGTWTAGELYGPLKSTGEASDGAGIGSPAHRAAKIFITANPGAKRFAWWSKLAAFLGSQKISSSEESLNLLLASRHAISAAKL